MKRVSRVLPLAAIIQSPATIHLVSTDNAVGVQVWCPCHTRNAIRYASSIVYSGFDAGSFTAVS